MTVQRWFAFVALGCSALVQGCAHRHGAAIPASNVEHASIPPVDSEEGTPFGTRLLDVGIYFADVPSTEPQPVVESALSALAGFARVERPRCDPSGPTVAAMVTSTEDFGLPETDYLEHFSHDVSIDTLDAVEHSNRLVVMSFCIPPDRDVGLLRDAYRSVVDIAQQTGGYVWDADSRELFSPRAFEVDRVEAWDGDLPEVRRQIGVHVYEHEGALRAVTLGMIRFGRQDVVLEPIGNTVLDRGDELLELAVQTLVERAPVLDPGTLEVEVSGIRCAPVRSRLEAALGEGATGRAALRTTRVGPVEGDPDNHLLAIAMPPLTTDDRAQARFLDELFGVHDPVVQAEHDPELLGASERARERVFAMRSRFANGMPPGVRLRIEAPFDVEGGREWLWIDVETWKDGAIVGTILSHPRMTNEVARGQRVTVDEDLIFDYLLDDGEEHEGGETQEILRRRGG